MLFKYNPNETPQQNKARKQLGKDRREVLLYFIVGIIASIVYLVIDSKIRG